MKLINELTTILNHHLFWNRARIACLAQLIQALFLVRTVNLAELATAFKRKAKVSSSYRRIQRFFDFHFDLTWIVLIVKHLFAIDTEKLTLILDRTNWQFGKAKINILVLAIAWEGIAIPIFWLVLDRKGNSASRHRKMLLRKAIKTLGKAKIRLILADREFVGTDWFAFLVSEKLPFCIRVQKKYLVYGKNAGPACLKHLFRNLKPFRKKILKTSYLLWGIPVYLSARRADHDDVLILASSVYLENAPEEYAKRWEIETLFGCLKKRGFRMEETHLTNPQKIGKLFFVLTIAFCWAYKLGNIKRLTNPIKVKNHGRLLYSFFRYGFDEIRQVFLNLSHNLKKLFYILKVFSKRGIVAYV